MFLLLLIHKTKLWQWVTINYPQPLSGHRRGILIKCISNIPDLDECEYFCNILQGAHIDQGQGLEERAGPDDHQQFGEQVKVCLEVLHRSVVHKLLANLPSGCPPEEHIDQQQKENGGVEYGERRGPNLEYTQFDNFFLIKKFLFIRALG